MTFLRDSVGLEGALIVVGTACAAVAGAFFFGLGGAFAAVAVITLALGFAVALRGA